MNIGHRKTFWKIADESEVSVGTAPFLLKGDRTLNITTGLSTLGNGPMGREVGNPNLSSD